MGGSANGMEAMQLVRTQRPAVVLMDIRMPGMDRLEASRHLAQMDEPPAIIFTTTCSEHGLEASDAHAGSYLVKPIRQERLEQALNKARRLTQAQLATLSMESGPQGRSHICAHIRGNLELISVDDVIFVQADQKYITVRHRNGERLMEDALENLETEFKERFICIHRNALANIAHISGMEKSCDVRFLMVFKGIRDRLGIGRP